MYNHSMFQCDNGFYLFHEAKYVLVHIYIFYVHVLYIKHVIHYIYHNGTDLKPKVYSITKLMYIQVQTHKKHSDKALSHFDI